jgi:hypothetical protein
MERDYRAGTVSTQDFCDFYVGTLAGRSAGRVAAAARGASWRECVLPRLCGGPATASTQHRTPATRWC